MVKVLIDAVSMYKAKEVAEVLIHAAGVDQAVNVANALFRAVPEDQAKKVAKILVRAVPVKQAFGSLVTNDVPEAMKPISCMGTLSFANFDHLFNAFELIWPNLSDEDFDSAQIHFHADEESRRAESLEMFRERVLLGRMFL